MAFSFKGKEFFWRIKTGELKERITDSDKCIVQRICSDGKRSFAYFESWEAFKIWYVRIDHTERTFSEVIRYNPQKFRIDIDCDQTHINKETLLHTILEELRTVLNFGLEFSGNAIKPEILVYETLDCLNITKNKRISFHLVTANLYADTARECFLVAKMVAERAGDFGMFVDTNVYKSLQCFRLEGSRKVEQNVMRYKYIRGRNDISERFLDGIITNVENCYKLNIPSFVFENTRIHCARYERSEYERSDLTVRKAPCERSEYKIPYPYICSKCGKVVILTIQLINFVCLSCQSY